MIKFENASTLGRGDHIKVKQVIKVGPNHSRYQELKGRPVEVTIGRIEFSRDGKFRYFHPKNNELNPTIIDDDLDKLKERIEKHHTTENQSS